MLIVYQINNLINLLMILLNTFQIIRFNLNI
jgi:hypothetical protein